MSEVVIANLLHIRTKGVVFETLIYLFSQLLHPPLHQSRTSLRLLETKPVD
jgi:hypothetical protein